MSDGDVSQLYAAAKGAQIPRNGVIALLDDPNVGFILQGAFVRVLLELHDRREDYLLARIVGVEHGEPYSGFSQLQSQTTTLLLKLQLPSHLAGVNGSLYQLLSISNSVMTEVEFERWMSVTSPEFGSPTIGELQIIADRIRPYLGRRAASNNNNNPANGVVASQQRPAGVMPSVAAPRNSGVVAPVPTNGLSAGATIANFVPPAPGFAGHGDLGAIAPVASASPTAPPPDATEHGGFDIPTRQQLMHQLLNEMRDSNAVFARNVGDMKVTQLRLAERDLGEYLENVREAISSKRSTCVVCMDQVASVIMLPCRHKVLCRLCGSSVSSCPICRQLAVELFEPEEI